MSARTWRWVAAGTAIVVFGAGATFLLLPRESAQQTAEEFATALEKGDLDGIAASGITVPRSAATAFAAATEYPKDVRVTRSEQHDNSATVTLSYRLGGASHRATLGAHENEGEWFLDSDDAFGTLTSTVSLGEAVAIDSATFGSGDSVALLPARYEVTASPSDILEGDTTATVLLGKKAAAEVTAALSDGAQAIAQTHLSDYLGTCTAPATSIPASCGVHIPWGTDFSALSGATFRIEKEPTLALTETRFTATGGELVATLTGTGRDGAQKTATYRTTEWAVRGSVTITAKGVNLAVW